MSENNTYTVQSGDTLYGIARRFNTSVQSIRELNNLITDIITPGQLLIISQNNEENPSECVIYTVKAGDNLYNIARKYDTTVEEIKRFNNLTSNNLSIGQKIRIPCFINEDDNIDNVLPNYVSYVVQKGDSLYAIAKKFGTTVDKIKKDNNLVNNNLTIGSTLLVEDNTGIVAVEECFGEEFELPNNYIVYSVQKGDSLYSIAKKFGTTVSEIQRLNNLDSTNLSIGQELKIPSNTSGGSTTYTVQKGDSLYSIAKKFGTTVNAIQSLNNLTSNSLSIGQKLKIPSSTSGGTGPSPTTYIVQKGESLYSIAKKFNTTVDSIKEKNNLTSNLLSVGQELII